MHILVGLQQNILLTEEDTCHFGVEVVNEVAAVITLTAIQGYGKGRLNCSMLKVFVAKS